MTMEIGAIRGGSLDILGASESLKTVLGHISSPELLRIEELRLFDGITRVVLRSKLSTRPPTAEVKAARHQSAI